MSDNKNTAVPEPADHSTTPTLTFMSFSPSPRYLLVTLLEDIEKKQKADSEATAFASSVLPVPVQCLGREEIASGRGLLQIF